MTELNQFAAHAINRSVPCERSSLFQFIRGATGAPDNDGRIGKTVEAAFRQRNFVNLVRELGKSDLAKMKVNDKQPL
ncbi:hypothetical protein EVAR_36588_1 [Eumeta japonica]|uniref:Uncharacterized protein n=1 Tax=Eumeta variegata TaxID=151549 RepID=A0A4C1XNB6_EUMVA|nr:hypothetical protein EVAR_36588_1 [Eumeta japonica]